MMLLCPKTWINRAVIDVAWFWARGLHTILLPPVTLETVHKTLLHPYNSSLLPLLPPLALFGTPDYRSGATPLHGDIRGRDYQIRGHSRSGSLVLLTLEYDALLWHAERARAHIVSKICSKYFFVITLPVSFERSYIFPLCLDQFSSQHPKPAGVWNINRTQGHMIRLDILISCRTRSLATTSWTRCTHGFSVNLWISSFLLILIEGP